MRTHAIDCDLPPDCSCAGVMTPTTVSVMTPTKLRIAEIEARAQELGKRSQFTFSPRDARFYADRSRQLMAEAEALRWSHAFDPCLISGRCGVCGQRAGECQ